MKKNEKAKSVLRSIGFTEGDFPYMMVKSLIADDEHTVEAQAVLYESSYVSIYIVVTWLKIGGSIHLANTTCKADEDLKKAFKDTWDKAKTIISKLAMKMMTVGG